jgi:hypothetical protein
MNANPIVARPTVRHGHPRAKFGADDRLAQDSGCTCPQKSTISPVAEVTRFSQFVPL